MYVNRKTQLETKKIETQEPWFNENGDLRSDKEISDLGKSWDQETWDRYLSFDQRYVEEFLIQLSLNFTPSYKTQC